MPSNLFGHFKGALELLIFVRMSPVWIFEDYWVDTIIRGKIKIKINTQNRNVSFGIKIHNFTYLQIGRFCLKLIELGSLIC